MPTKPKQHKHKFRFSGWRGTGAETLVRFRCCHGTSGLGWCSESVERLATPVEAAHLNQRFAKPPRDRDIHAVAREFDRKFRDYTGKIASTWKKTGYALMYAVERWAKKYPEDVRLVSCDDSYFTGSRLVLIEHRAKRSYMGTTLISIPQLSDNPCEMFLYPHSVEALGKAMRDIRRQATPLEKQEAEDVAEESRVTQSWRFSDDKKKAKK